MEQTENEFGIHNKEPEVKTEEQEATGQPTGDEQPKTGEEEKVGEDLKDLQAKCRKTQRRQYLLEKLWICVVVMIAVSMVGWLVTGKWINAVNNLLWLFVAWMYWRQQKAMLCAGEFTLHLLGKCFNLTKQVEMYEMVLKSYSEKDEIWQKLDANNEKIIANQEMQIANLEKLIANLEKSNDLRQQIIDTQEKLIEHPKKEG